MARIIIEHDHADGLSTGTVIDLDRLPSRSIEAAAKALMKWDAADLGGTYAESVEAAIRAFLADLEQGDQE